MKTFIDDMMELLDQEPGPTKWKRFSVLGMISGILGRRVYVPYGAGSKTFANLFIFIVGRAGSGKSQIISKVKERVIEYNNSMQDTYGVPLSSDKLNGATFLEELITSYHPLEDHSSLFVLQDEMGALFQDFGAVTFATDLLKYFDCPLEFSKRIRDKHEVAKNVYVAILSGTTKNFLKRYLPSESRGDGLVSRSIYVHEPEIAIEDKFQRSKPKAEVDHLLNKIRTVSIPRLRNLKGIMKEDDEAFEYMKELTDQFSEQQYKYPDGSVLDGYFARKSMQVIKVAMCLAASEYSMRIEKRHYEQANEWLIECEPFMNDIFGTGEMQYNKEATANLLGLLPIGQKHALPMKEILNQAAMLDGMMPNDLALVYEKLLTLEAMGKITIEKNESGTPIKAYRNTLTL